ncbi:hypothetical protein HYX18_00055, partial [Candidatus Woesearchaeota archaeon]|nr:hypothetical protein [Candidatus Woesearchaeota archaeon]
FSSNWTDNVALDSFIFEINHTNLFRNSSSYKFGSATGNTSSNITFITVAIETNVSWRFWVNDSSSNWNYSGTESFLVSTGDATKPLWNLTAKNETVVYQNTLINFSVIFTDETELGNAILSINLTGNFVNSSPYSLIGTFTNISNVTRINALQGNNVTWFWFFNDSSGNNNITDMKSFIVVDNTTPLYNLTAKNQTKVFSNDLINFSALVSDNIRLQGFIFSINLTNNFVNSSFVSLTDSFNNISNITRINALQGINVTYFFWFNDTSGNNNYTQWQSFLVEDNTTPLYNNTFKNESAVYENILINFSTIITDNFRLDRFVFSINLTGNFVNSSFIPLSATFHNVSNVTRIIASQGNNVTWFFWFNDTFGNSNYTQWQSFTVIDDTTPLWNLTLKNQSTIFQNDLINFSIILSDNVALSNAVFSINQDGIFKNSSIYILTGKYANLSNETRITSSVGTNVTWFWFFNDSSGNNNITDMKSFIVNDSVPPVLISGTSQIKNQTTINQNMYVNFSANWTDDVALDSFIFSLDTGDGGGFKNSTFIKFSANNISSNVTLFGTNFIGNNISWKFIANDTSANYNETKPDSFNLTDSLLPNFTATMQNITSVRQNEIVNFSANLTDNYKLKGFVFSINLGSGFMNNSFAYISNTFYVVSNETRITSSVGTNVTWFFVYNDTFDNQNVTLMRSFIIADNTTPVFIIGSVLKNETNVYQDYFVNFSANWTDDVALGSFIFSLDTGDGSGYRNSSSYRFGSITGNISSNISFFSSSLISNNISWKLIVNDSSNNWNETSPNSFNLSDNIKPLSSDFQINQTTIYNNQYANFTANLTDNYKLQGFIFSVNLTGNFVNSSFIPLSATFHNVSNVTQIKSQEGNNVSYFFYFNDTFGNSNKTEVRSFIVADNTKPLFNDAQKNMTVVLQNTLVNFTANLTDNVNLAGYLFSINLGSGFINSSYTGLLGAAYNISNITEIRAAQSVNVTWFFYFNDTSGNSNTTGLNSFIVVDNTTPTYVMGSVLKNQSSVLQNMFVNFSSNWTDNVAMDSFIFSIDQGSGYINSSSYKFGSATGNTSSNITFITAAPSTNVSWKFVVNDSSSNWNETGPDSFRALSSTAPNPNVTIDLPPSGVSTLNFRVNISVKSINTIDSCYYNITKGASQEVGQTLIANCNTNDSIYAVVSSDGDYVLRTFVNDSLGKENSTETKSFVVSIEAGGGVGGGGGGGTRITQNISISDTFSLDRYIINVSLIPNQIKKEFIKIINNQDQAINVSVDLTNLKEFITFLDGATKHIFTLLPKEEKLIQIIFSASADIKPDLYSNAILVSSNGVSKIIYVIIEVESENPLFDSLINIKDKDLYVVPGSNLVAEISVFNIRKLFGFVDVNLDYEIRDLNGNLMLYEHETRGLRDRLTFTKKFFISRNFDPGTYILYIKVTYKGTSASSTRMFYVERGFSLRLPNYLLPSNQRLTTIVFQLIVLTALLIIYAKLKYKFKYGGKNKKIKIYKKETRIAKVYKPIVVSEKSKELVVIKDYKDKENKDNIK